MMKKMKEITFQSGLPITFHNGILRVPEQPRIPFIVGDGCGADIWKAARNVFDAAVERAYQGKRKVEWVEVFAGEKAFQLFNNWLPNETGAIFKKYLVGIKGPLTTPIGEGIRSLNVALRKELDLYVCQRPVRWLAGVPSAIKNPEKVDMVIFRENTEDVYTGIEFELGSEENEKLLNLLKKHFPKYFNQIRFPESVALGIKPISKQGTQRLVRAAIQWALEHQRRSVTLVHKGNIMKFTEGAFNKWGYEVAEKEFFATTFTLAQWLHTYKQYGEDRANLERKKALEAGKLLVKDVIADAAFEISITRPEELDVLATPNLNGDYLADALAALVGGIGIAPGGNINYQTGAAIFEATHGTAPMLANQDKANPCSLILSGEMMFRYLGWGEAADLINKGVRGAIKSRMVTFDFYQSMKNAVLLKTSEFGNVVVNNMS